MSKKLYAANAAEFIALHLPQMAVQFKPETNAYLAQISLQTWPKGHNFAQDQQPVTFAVLIASGLIRSFYLHNAAEVNLRFLAAGSLALPFASVAERWLNPQSNDLISSENLQSVSSVTGYAIPLAVLTQRQQSPQLDVLRLEIAAQHYLSMERRLRMIQQIRAIDRYRHFLAWMPHEIVQDMPSYHVASYLGMSPEVLSRLKRQLKQ